MEGSPHRPATSRNPPSVQVGGQAKQQQLQQQRIYATCRLFEPHEWKPNVCRNCFSSLLAHDRDNVHDRDEVHAPKPSRGLRLSKTIRVPHYDVFEFKLREREEVLPIVKSPRPAQPASVAKVSEHVAASVSTTAASLLPSPVSSDKRAVKEESDEAAACTSSASEEEDGRESERSDGNCDARSSSVDAADASAPAQERDASAEQQLLVALSMIDKLRAKVARKNTRLDEEENLHSILKDRMDGLLKEAAETESTQKRLLEEQAQGWQREKELWAQETALQRRMMEEQSQAWQLEKELWMQEASLHAQLSEERARNWQQEKERWAKEVALLKRLMEEQAQISQREKEFWMQEASSARSALSAMRWSAATQVDELHGSSPLLNEEEALVVNYDIPTVRKCQTIVRSWLARKRGTRLVALVRAFSVSPHAKTQRRRFATILELRKSERNYCEMIQHAVEHFMMPLLDKAEFGASFSCEDVENLFGNIEMLSIISQQFLQSLDQRFASTDQFACCGDIILKVQKVLPLYSAYYRKYEEANQLLRRLSENEEFTQYVEELQRTSTYNPLLALKVYLYRPCQRIPQYSLLLKQLLSYTTGEHVDYQNILTAAERIQKILTLLDRRTEVEQSKRKMQELQNKVVGYDTNLADDRARQFIEEDDWLLLPNKAGKQQEARQLAYSSWSSSEKLAPNMSPVGTVKARQLRVFVLSDMLLFGKAQDNNTYRYKFSIPLGGAVVTEMDGTTVSGHGHDNPLLIKGKSGTEHVFVFRDAAERRKWTAKLWPMILVLSEDGRVKPELRRRVNRGQHMRLTHIGMTNLMKVAMGQEPGASDIEEGGALPSPSSAEGTSARAMSFEGTDDGDTGANSRPSLFALFVRSRSSDGSRADSVSSDDSTESPRRMLLGSRTALAPQSRLEAKKPAAAEDRSAEFAAVVPDAAAAVDVSSLPSSSYTEDQQHRGDSDDDEVNSNGGSGIGGSSSLRRGSSDKSEAERDKESKARRAKREEERRERNRQKGKNSLTPSHRSDRRRVQSVACELDRRADITRIGDALDSSSSRPTLAQTHTNLQKPASPSSSWLEADRDPDRARRKADQQTTKRTLITSVRDSLRSKQQQQQPSLTSSSSSTKVTSPSNLMPLKHSGSTERLSPRGDSSKHERSRGDTRSRSREPEGLRSTEIKASEVQEARKRSRSNSFDEATLKRIVEAAQLPVSRLAEASNTSSRRHHKRSTSATNLNGDKDVLNGGGEDNDAQPSSPDRKKEERSKGSAGSRRG